MQIIHLICLACASGALPPPSCKRRRWRRRRRKCVALSALQASHFYLLRAGSLAGRREREAGELKGKSRSFDRPPAPRCFMQLFHLLNVNSWPFFLSRSLSAFELAQSFALPELPAARKQTKARVSARKCKTNVTRRPVGRPSLRALFSDCFPCCCCAINEVRIREIALWEGARGLADCLLARLEHRSPGTRRASKCVHFWLGFCASPRFFLSLAASNLTHCNLGLVFVPKRSRCWSAAVWRARGPSERLLCARPIQEGVKICIARRPEREREINRPTEEWRPADRQPRAPVSRVAWPEAQNESLAKAEPRPKANRIKSSQALHWLAQQTRMKNDHTRRKRRRRRPT